jgi:hypothetical protein
MLLVQWRACGCEHTSRAVLQVRQTARTNERITSTNGHPFQLFQREQWWVHATACEPAHAGWPGQGPPQVLVTLSDIRLPSASFCFAFALPFAFGGPTTAIGCGIKQYIRNGRHAVGLPSRGHSVPTVIGGPSNRAAAPLPCTTCKTAPRLSEPWGTALGIEIFGKHFEGGGLLSAPLHYNKLRRGKPRMAHVVNTHCNR